MLTSSTKCENFMFVRLNKDILSKKGSLRLGGSRHVFEEL